MEFKMPPSVPATVGMKPDDMVPIRADVLDEIRGALLNMEDTIVRLQSQPLVYASVVRADNKFNMAAYEKDDRMIILDKDLLKAKKFWCRIISKGVDKDGYVEVQFWNGERTRLNIGLKGLPQVKLVGKDDGMNVVISHKDQLVEVHGLPTKKLLRGDLVKVDMETKQIHDTTPLTGTGDVAHIKSIIDGDHVEVEANGFCKVVLVGEFPKKLEVSDRVMLDSTSAIVVRVLERDGKDRFNLVEQSDTTWDDIAGLEDAKEHLVEALELPYQFPDLFKYYNKKPPKGVLLYGPPGCGKTLCGKAAANSLARIHGKENYQSGFIYVKGPELLSKWVGAAEAEVRQLFVRGREHYAKHGYPALLFIDEADAIVPQRGSGKSMDIENTVVPMFLSEMDGLTDNHVMVLLATNQPKRIDPAVTREGRIDRHVKVCRPTQKTAGEYFKIHMKNIPVARSSTPKELAALAIADLFSAERVLFRLASKSLPEPLNFNMGHCVTGAMIATLVDHATSLAIKRDMKTKKQSGIMPEDFQLAINSLHRQHAELNLAYDIEDFCSGHGIEAQSCSLQKAAYSAV